MAQAATAAPRAPPRSRRSSTNLAHLRLAPLSDKFDARRDAPAAGAKSPYDETQDFARNHSSYLQGKSAPTTPGILSRNSSRRRVGGGLSRRGSLYDNDAVAFEYAGSMKTGERADPSSAKIPKAMSEAALSLQQQHLPHGSRSSGSAKTKLLYSQPAGSGGPTPRVRSRAKLTSDDWFTRTGAATNALVRKSKGQSWQTAGGATDSTDDDDEGYEEMAAMSSSATIRATPSAGTTSPISTRASQWGSRYGSRAASRRASRRGSIVGSRTPLAPVFGPDVMTSYFDGPPSAFDAESAAYDDATEGDSADEREVARLATESSSTGLSGLVERVTGSKLFHVEEERGGISTDDDYAMPLRETEAEARARREAESRRKREQKERLVAVPPPIDEAEGAEQADVGWRDAAWLLSVATRALFSDAGQ